MNLKEYQTLYREAEAPYDKQWKFTNTVLQILMIVGPLFFAAMFFFLGNGVSEVIDVELGYKLFLPFSFFAAVMYFLSKGSVSRQKYLTAIGYIVFCILAYVINMAPKLFLFIAGLPGSPEEVCS